MGHHDRGHGPCGPAYAAFKNIEQGFEQVRRQHRGGPWGGAWGGAWGGGPWGGPSGPFGHRGGHGGPPPWLAGLFGLGRPEAGRGARVRRGDVRAAILDVLRTAGEQGETPNGYQVIQAITERSGGVWRPSPGSVYPTIQQLEDEGLVESVDERGRRALRLTEEGGTYCAEHPDELAAVWAPFESRAEGDDAQHADIKSEIGQVMSAVWQIVTSGDDAQKRALIEILVDARRRLYGVLADGPQQDRTEEE